MASAYQIRSSKLKIEQLDSDSFYITWDLTSKQDNEKITQNVWKKRSGKFDEYAITTKKFADCIDKWDIRWYYKISGDKNWHPQGGEKIEIDDSNKSGAITTRSDSQPYTPPTNAIAILAKIAPVPKQYKSSKTKKANWFTKPDFTSVSQKYTPNPNAPSIDTWTITGNTYKVVVSFDTVASDVDYCKIEFLKNNVTVMEGATQEFKKASSTQNQRGTCVFTGTFDEIGTYQVRASVGIYNSTDKQIYWSEPCDWASSIDTRPDTPGDVTVTVIGSDKVRVSWTPTSEANVSSYKIEYVSDSSDYFDSGNAQSVTVDGSLSTYIISGLEAGHTWYFRVRSVNGSDESDAGDIASVVLVTKPSAPTTWSSKTIATIQTSVGSTDPIYLYWIHNSQDGSAQIDAQIRITIAGTTYYYLWENTNKNDYGELQDETSELELWPLSLYTTEGANTSIVGTVYDLIKSSNAQSLTWKVRTRGLYTADDGSTDGDYSDWSVEREICVYTKPNLYLSVTEGTGSSLVGNIFTSFPMTLTCSTTPSSQTPISYHVSITTNSSYETIDRYGEEVIILDGTEIFSKYIDPNSSDISSTSSGKKYEFSINASDVDLVSDTDIGYTVYVVVYMDSGLSAEASYNFRVEWDEESQIPNAEIVYDEEYRYATIRPYCLYYLGEDDSMDDDGIESKAYYGTAITGTSETATVFSSSGITSAVYGDIYFNPSTCNVYSCALGGDASTATWIYKDTINFEDAGTWYSGTVIDGEGENGIYPSSGISLALVNDYYFNTDDGNIYCCVKAGDASTAIWEYVHNCFWDYTPNTTLSVYRKEQNGTFTIIKENIGNNVGITVLDPHPNFGVCTYRIVSTNVLNGGIAYADFEENTEETSIIIQWDEAWNDGSEEAETAAVFEGSVLELPANVKLKDTNTNDVTLAEYIGRSRPVSYYGTQRGESPSLSCVFPKNDTETLSKLRRLMAWQGDVYVREPSGLGYWANVTVSYDRNYNDVTIPVSITVKPVEGGI